MDAKSGVSSGIYRQTDCGLTADIQWNCHRRRQDTMIMLQSADNFPLNNPLHFTWYIFILLLRLGHGYV